MRSKIDHHRKQRNQGRSIKPTDQKRIRAMRLMDDAFMTACLSDNIPCTELIIRIILDRDDIEVKSVSTQYHIHNFKGKSVTFDVYAEDTEGKAYDIEIQRASRGAMPKRARYHSSLMDASITEPGDGFERLRESYVIFITDKDVLEEGLPVYHVERYIEEVRRPFADGSHIIYVNGENRDESPLGLLMRDMHCTDPDDMNYDILAKEVRQFKYSKEGVKIMSGMISDLIEEGRIEGLKEGAIEAATRMIKAGKYTEQEISDILSLSVEEVRELIKKLG